MKWPAAGAILIALLGLASVSAPSILALYQLQEGGRLLENATKMNGSSSNTDWGDIYACTRDIIIEETARKEIYQAVAYLQQALASPLSRSEANLLLGRSYCLLGQYENAVAAYQAHVSERPHDPLGHLELGFADEALCNQKGTAAASISASPKPAPLCKDGDKQLAMRAEWREAGASGQEFLYLAERARNDGSYKEAYNWFARASMLFELDASYLFRWGISAVLGGYGIPGAAMDSIRVYQADNSIQIPAREMQWIPGSAEGHLDYGDSLSKSPTADPSLGVISKEGAAVFVARVPKGAVYRMRIRALDSMPAAGELQIEQDTRPVAQFAITGDWSEFETNLQLTAGLHIIGVRYAQGAGNAVLDWVRLSGTGPAS